MIGSSTLDRLAVLPDLTGIPRPQLAWLAARGELRRFDAGGILYSPDHPNGIIHSSEAEDVGLFVVLAGRLAVYRLDRSGVAREIGDLTPGVVSGMLPYSRVRRGSTGSIVAREPSEILLVASGALREMTRDCYEFTELCVHQMLDRVRLFRSDELQEEKMASLGRLAAGVAHELNNPSSAIGRSAAELNACRTDVAISARDLGAAAFGPEETAALARLEAAAQRPRDDDSSTLVARVDREDAIEAWLADRGVDVSLTDRLVATGVAVSDLNAARADLPGDRLAIALRYVAANVTARRLTTEIETAARRIHALVASVKKHTQLDRAPSVDLIHLEAHLRDTLNLVGSRAAHKGVALDVSVEPALPPVRGVVGELNQVWLNLIDNAIDAAAEHGRVEVTAGSGQGTVVVRVIDDGPGIAADALPRIFEPFFTTKPVGQGVGLGLDVVQTVVRSHRGTVDVKSRPGRTEFRVSIPAI